MTEPWQHLPAQALADHFVKMIDNRGNDDEEDDESPRALRERDDRERAGEEMNDFRENPQ